MSRVASNSKLVTRLVGVAVGMFAFGVFAMPPLYDKFCEITGIGQAGIQVVDAAPMTGTSRRTVKIRFDATTNSALNWDFRPMEKSLQVTLGEPAVASYFAGNLDSQTVAGRAVFNVSPPTAARYFVKTECFCFTRQELAGKEQREMPVYFFVQEDLPEDIEELTLSYTFFKQES
jgi:cytochrome c oxidase assembly protein subunit 11